MEIAWILANPLHINRTLFYRNNPSSCWMPYWKHPSYRVLADNLPSPGYRLMEELKAQGYKLVSPPSDCNLCPIEGSSPRVFIELNKDLADSPNPSVQDLYKEATKDIRGWRGCS